MRNYHRKPRFRHPKESWRSIEWRLQHWDWKNRINELKKEGKKGKEKRGRRDGDGDGDEDGWDGMVWCVGEAKGQAHVHGL